MNKEPLYKARGDIYAGETKTRVEVTSVEAELELLVGEKEAPEVYNADESALFELGPFQVTFDLRHSKVHSICKAPTAYRRFEFTLPSQHVGCDSVH